MWHVEVSTVFDKEYRDATMRVRAVVWNESATAFRGKVELALAGPLPGSETVAKAASPLGEMAPWQRTAVDIAAACRAADVDRRGATPLWAFRSTAPRGQVAEEFTLRTGCRQTEIRGTEVLINGRPVKFRGTCHHDSHPLLGRAVTAALERQDLKLMKEANLNAVRTSHYPPLPELAEIADELGLYVEGEASFCWTDTANDLRYTPRIIQLTVEMLARDRNHPSVAHWSLCNESQFGYGFVRSHEWVRQADPSRPTSAASPSTIGLEIATLHNPISVHRIDKQKICGSRCCSMRAWPSSKTSG